MSSEKVAGGPDTRRLLRESIPAAVILLFWLALSVPVRPSISAGLSQAGIIMTILYTVVRGVMLGQEFRPISQTTGLKGILRENVRVTFPAGAWFISAQIVYEIEGLWDTLGIPGAFTSPADGLVFVLNGAGIAVVVIHAVWVGSPYIHGEIETLETEQTASPQSDD